MKTSVQPSDAIDALVATVDHDEERRQACLASVLRGRMLTRRIGRNTEKAVWQMDGNKLISAIRDMAAAQNPIATEVV
jgi:hypothetical protein